MSEKKPTIYIAGPMTGYPRFNFPLFETVAKNLRLQGHIVVSPHELDSQETRRDAWASKDGKVTQAMESWGECLARDVKLLADGHHRGDETDTIDAIALLPNWEKSRGARLEAFVGLLTGKSYYVVVSDSEGVLLSPRSPEWVEHTLASVWNGVKVYRTGAE